MVRHDPDRLYPNPNGPNLPQVPGSWLFDNGNARDRKSGELEGIHPDTRYLFDLLNSAKRENKKNQKFWREIYHPHYKKWKELDTYLKKKTFEEKVKYGILKPTKSYKDGGKQDGRSSSVDSRQKDSIKEETPSTTYEPADDDDDGVQAGYQALLDRIQQRNEASRKALAAEDSDSDSDGFSLHGPSDPATIKSTSLSEPTATTQKRPIILRFPLKKLEPQPSVPDVKEAVKTSDTPALETQVSSSQRPDKSSTFESPTKTFEGHLKSSGISSIEFSPTRVSFDKPRVDFPTVSTGSFEFLLVCPN